MQTIKNYLKKGGSLIKETNKYDMYDDIYTSDLGYTSVKSKMKNSLKNTNNSIENDVEDVIFDGGNINNDILIKQHRDQLEEEKLNYEKDDLILKQMIKHNMNRDDSDIKESYNEIYTNFMKDEEQQKMVYNDLKEKDNEKFLNKYAEELGIDPNTLEDNTEKKKKKKKKKIVELLIKLLHL